MGFSPNQGRNATTFGSVKGVVNSLMEEMKGIVSTPVKPSQNRRKRVMVMGINLNELRDCLATLDWICLILFSCFWIFLRSFLSPVRFAFSDSDVHFWISFLHFLSCSLFSLLVKRLLMKVMRNESNADTPRMMAVA